MVKQIGRRGAKSDSSRVGWPVGSGCGLRRDKIDASRMRTVDERELEPKSPESRFDVNTMCCEARSRPRAAPRASPPHTLCRCNSSAAPPARRLYLRAQPVVAKTTRLAQQTRSRSRSPPFSHSRRKQNERDEKTNANAKANIRRRQTSIPDAPANRASPSCAERKQKSIITC